MQLINMMNTKVYALCAGIFVVLAILARKRFGIATGNVLLNVLLFATFIAVFFFTYAVIIEKEIVDDQISYITQGLVSDIALLPPDVKNEMNRKLQAMDSNSESMKAADKKADDNNKKIIKDTIIKIVIAWVVLGLFIVFLIRSDNNYYDFSAKKLLVQAFIALAGIGITEFLFLKYLARYYKSGDPNFVKLQILQNIN